MMELAKLFKLILRHRYTLLVIPISTVVITYFLVRNLPEVYFSQAQIATGIVDETQQVLDGEERNSQESQINQEFSNLIEMMRMKKMVDQVSYRLIIHDLTSPKPFRKLSSLITDLNPKARKHALDVYRKKYQKREGLSLWDKDQNGLHMVLRSMGYDGESLKQKLNIYRSNNSDFIYVEFSSDDSELSAFVVNALCSEFITYYTSIVKENQKKAVDFLGALLNEKYAAMNQKIALLRAYKIKNRVLNLYEQSKLLYTMILEFESQLQRTQKDIVAYNGAIVSINNKFEPEDRKYLQSTLTKVNQEILSTKQKLRSLHLKHIESNFKESYKSSIDSLEDLLSSQINISIDKYIYNPLSAKENLVQQKIELEIQLDLAQFSVRSIENKIKDMNNQFDKLVPHEAVVQSYERDIDVASREYLEILSKYNETNMRSGYSINLRQVQEAMPGLPLPSKKMLLVILSGIISFVFCLVILFAIFFFDDSVTSPKELAQKTDIPVFGRLKQIPGSKLDFSELQNSKNTKSSIQDLKDELRSIRFEIDRELKDSEKVIGITSAKAGEGKTFAAVSLAYAYSMISKRVLVIDGNFLNPAISKTAHPKYYLEDIFKNESIQPEFENDLINILGNRGEDYSLLELSKEETISKKLEEFKSIFDIIIIETAPLEFMSKSKEWLLFTDKILALMEANQSIRGSRKQQINYLKSLDGRFVGWILNKVPQEAEKNKKKWFKKI